MPENRVLHAAHLLASVFIVLLFAGARGFFAAQPLLGALLLLAFVPAYYIAARMTSFGPFLYPALILLTAGWQLLLYAAGAGGAWQLLVILVPLAGLQLALALRIEARLPGAGRVCGNLHDAIIALFAAWIAIRIVEYYRTAPGLMALALFAYALLAWIRCAATKQVRHSAAGVLLASGGFSILVFSDPAAAMLLAATAAAAILLVLIARRSLTSIETALFMPGLAAVLFAAVMNIREGAHFVACVALGIVWIIVTLLLYRPERVPLLGPDVATFPLIVPPLIAGFAFAIVPLFTFRTWTTPDLLGAMLMAIIVPLWAVGDRLSAYAVTLAAHAFARTSGALARLALGAMLIEAVMLRLASSRLFAASLLLAGAIALVIAWMRPPRVITIRNAYAWMGGAALAFGYFVLIAPSPAASTTDLLLQSGFVALYALLLIGAAGTARSKEIFGRSVAETAAVAAAVAVILAAVRATGWSGDAVAIGLLLIGASGSVFIRWRRPFVLFTAPAVVGYWIYVAALSAGVKGEALGIPYLVLGALSAWIGVRLRARGSDWSELAWFCCLLCTCASLILFVPFANAGAWLMPLWSIVFLAVARTASIRRNALFAAFFEVLAAVVAIGVVIADAAGRNFLPAAAAALLVAIAWEWIAMVQRAVLYVYAAPIAATASILLACARAESLNTFLSWFFIAAALFVISAIVCRRRGDLHAARSLEIATGIGAVTGAALFLITPFAATVWIHPATAAAYLVLFLAAAATSRKNGYVTAFALAGALAVYEILPFISGVSAANRLAVFIPFTILIAASGIYRQIRGEAKIAWSVYAAAVPPALLASLFSVWPEPVSSTAARAVLVVAMLLWVMLLMATRREAFIYLATLSLALLAYNTVQSSADVFERHMVAFFLGGVVLLGAVFAAAGIRPHVRFRSPALFTRVAPWPQRFAYGAPIVVLGLASFGGWGVTASSSPQFCGSCHQMGTSFATWSASPHARVACSSCHIEPTVGGYITAKLQGTSQLVKTLTNARMVKPMAQVDNNRCVGCHPLRKLGTTIRVHDAWSFNHARHFGPLFKRGPTALRCTSCHNGANTTAHFAVDSNACFTCHFLNARDPFQRRVGCVGCHGLPGPGSRFDHVSAAVAANDTACVECHDAVMLASLSVELRSCRQCHDTLPRLDSVSATAIHRTHVTAQSITCDRCHGVVHHVPAAKPVKLAMK